MFGLGTLGERRAQRRERLREPLLNLRITRGESFEVRWKGAPTLVVTELRELPADTELQLGRGTADPSTDPPAPAVTPGSADAADGGVAKGSSEAI